MSSEEGHSYTKSFNVESSYWSKKENIERGYLDVHAGDNLGSILFFNLSDSGSAKISVRVCDINGMSRHVDYPDRCMEQLRDWLTHHLREVD